MFIIVWIALCFVAGSIASNKGRSGVGFFFVALILSPLVGIVAALVARPMGRAVERQQIESGDMKKCPFCAELIKLEAKVCRYCGRDLSTGKSDEVDGFENWLSAQHPPIVDPSAAQRAEYRAAYDYKRKMGEL